MLFFRRTDPKLILLIEIQSSLIRGSVLRIEATGTSVQASQSLEIEYREAAGASYIKSALAGVSTLVDSLLRAISARTTGSAGKIGAVHFVLSSPWAISQAKTISVSFDKDTSITQDRIHAILAAERPNTGLNPNMAAEIIEEKVFDVRLNGYSIADWKGKSAKMVEIAYALSVGSAETMKNLRQSVARVADPHHVHFHSSLLLQYMSLRQANVPGDPYVLVHVHGELTDIVAVRHGMCSFFGSFPIGSDSIVRKIAASRRIGTKAAESLVSLYLGKHMDPAEEAKTGTSIRHSMGRWSQELSRIAAAMNGLSPTAVFLISHSHEQLFSEALRAAYPQAAIQELSVDMTTTYASAISVIS